MPPNAVCEPRHRVHRLGALLTEHLDERRAHALGNDPDFAFVVRIDFANHTDQMPTVPPVQSVSALLF